MTTEFPLKLPEPIAIRDRLMGLDDEARFLRRRLRLINKKARDGRQPNATPMAGKAVAGAY